MHHSIPSPPSHTQSNFVALQHTPSNNIPRGRELPRTPLNGAAPSTAAVAAAAQRTASQAGGADAAPPAATPARTRVTGSRSPSLSLPARDAAGGDVGMAEPEGLEGARTPRER